MQIKKYIYYINQGIINVAPCVNWHAYYRMVDSDTEIFEYIPAIFLFSISPAQCLIKNISKHLFHFIRSSTKITEFDNVKFPKSVSSKDGFWREFLKIDSNSTFSKNKKKTIKNPWIFLSFFFSQLVIVTWLSQNKFIVHPHFENNRFTPLIIFPM